MFERTILGIDIGTYSTKLVEIRAGLRQLELHRCEELVFARDAGTADREASLRSYLETEGIKLERVVSALPANRITQRHLRFPFRGKKVAAAIPLAVDEDLPISLNEMVMTHEVALLKGPTSPQTDVLALLAQRQEVAEHLASAERAGFDPAVLEVEGTVLGNAAAMLGADEAPRLFMDIGHRKTNVTLVAGGRPLLLRSIPIAGRHFTEALAAELNLELEAAEQHKHEEGVFKPDSITPVSPRLAALLDQLARETLRSVQARVSDAVDPIAPIEIVLVGGSSCLAGLGGYLHERTQLPCRVARISDQAVGAGLLASQPAPAVYAQALALALRGTPSAATTQADFRQGEFRYAPDLSGLRPELQRLGVLFALVLALWPASHVAELLAISRQANTLRDRLSEIHRQALPGVPVPADPLKSLEKRYEQATELANHLGVTGNGTSPLELLREISARIPPELDVSLVELRLERYSIRARGFAPDFELVGRVKNELAKVEIFEDVIVSNVQNQRRQSGKSFELTIELRRKR